MAGNIFGKILRLTTFGESHGEAIGGVLDGFPAGVEIDTDFIKKQMNRRRPGQSELTTSRDEADEPVLLSGVFRGISTGTPIAFIILNKNQRSEDYDKIAEAFRPSHADYTYTAKYGFRDFRGGGRSSARETAARVAAGALAMLFLQKKGITVTAYTVQIGNVSARISGETDFDTVEASPVRCPDTVASRKMEDLIRKTAAAKDTLGGIVECVIKGVPPGLGEPVFDKLHADLGKAMLGINAVKGFEIGEGFALAGAKGSQVNDLFENKNGKIRTRTNHSGGIQGGISNGEEIFFRVAFKPVATLMREQQTVDKEGNPVVLPPKGRHDVCVVPRAVPIVEAMAALVIADHWLQNKAAKL